MGNLEFRLLNEFQRAFPLVSEPFREIAAATATDEGSVLRLLARLKEVGRVSRLGAVLAPRRIGASTLGALAAPAGELSRIAARVSAYSEVNHNYEREHRLNLWFVVTAADDERLGSVLASIERETACRVISLALLEQFHIDLGFDLAGNNARLSPRSAPADGRRYEPNAAERRLLAALQSGLDLVPRPYARLATKVGMSEDAVLAMLGRWQEEGLIARFGVVVRHRQLGFAANAMVVWDIPDDRVRAVGTKLAGEPAVTLCYRRQRHQPEWRYNLFCMVHGRHRLDVAGEIGALRDRCGLHAYPSAVLFSRRCFKQRGARYFDDIEADAYG